MRCAEIACFFGSVDGGAWECFPPALTHFFYILFNFSAAVRLHQEQRLFPVLIQPPEPAFDFPVDRLRAHLLFVGSEEDSKI